MERAPLLILGMLSLLAGLAGGLVRVGWAVPSVPPEAVAQHGALMLAGFLGTLISLEKAVALRRAFGYAAPVLIGVGTISLWAGGPVVPGRAAVALGGATFFAVLAFGLYERATRWTATQLAGAACFAIGAFAWLAGRNLVDVIPWWAAFVILTIAGERLELSRLLAPTRAARECMNVNPTIDIVITQVSLKDGNWCDVLAFVVNRGVEARVVVSSTVADERFWSEALWRGVYDVLLEPYDVLEVRRIVDGALLAAEQRRGLAKARFNQPHERVHRRRLVQPLSADHQRGAARRRQQQDPHDALPVHHLAIPPDADLRAELRGEVDEPRRRPRMQPEGV